MAINMVIYIFDKSENLLGYLDPEDFATCIHTKKLSGENYIEFTIPDNVSNANKAQYFQEGYFIGFYDMDNAFQMFEIQTLEVEDADQVLKSGYAEHVSYELNDTIVLDKREKQKTASAAIVAALTGSRWELGWCDYFGIKTQNFYYESSQSCLTKIQDTWTYRGSDGRTSKGSFNFRLILSGNNIIHRYVDFRLQTGSWSGKRFTAKKDMDRMKRKIDMTNIATAVYGRGKGVKITKIKDGVVVQTGSATSSTRLGFDSLIWKKNVVFAEENFTSLSRWAITNGSGVSISAAYNFESPTALKMTDTAGDFPQTILTNDYYACLPNTRTTVYAKLLVPDNTAKGNTKSKAGILSLKFYTSAHALISTATQTVMPDKKLFGEWQDIYIVATSPATTAYIKVELSTAADGKYKGDIYWDKINVSDPIDKPANQGYVEDPAAKAKWGRAAGTLHRWKVFVDDSEDNAQNLLLKTWQFLQDNNDPIITYEVDAKDLETVTGYSHEKIRLGDLVYCLDENFRQPIEISARVMELTRDIFNPEDVQMVLGNFKNDTADIAAQQIALKNKVNAQSAIWDLGTVFEETETGDVRFRMDMDDEGGFESYIKYFDDSDPPNLIGYFTPDEFAWSTIRANKVIAQNLVMINQDAATFYIDSYAGDDQNDGSAAHPWATLGRLNNPSAIPKYISQTITINIIDSTPAGTTPFNEDVKLSGINGSAELDINIAADVVINGSFTITNCSSEVNILGVTGASINSTDATPPLYVDGCYNLLVSNMILNAANASYYAAQIYASRVQFTTCTLERVKSISYAAAVRAAKLSQVYLLNCRGSNPNGYCITAYDAAYVGVWTTVPFAGLGSANRVPYCTYNAGSIIAPSAMTGDTFPSSLKSTWDTGGAAPAPPAAATVTVMNCTETKSWREKYSSYRTDSDDIYQGSWGYGNYIGLWLFRESFNFNDLLGKTITSAKFYIRRRNAGGYSSAMTIHLWGHNYTTITTEPDLIKDYGIVASLKWGEELAFNLPKAVLNDIKAGTIDGLAIYEADGSPYVILQGDATYQSRISFIYNP